MTEQLSSVENILMAILARSNETRDLTNRTRLLHASERLDRLRSEMRERQPGNPAGHGWKSYSQNDEDGIIRYCLQKIASGCALKKTFVEIGIGAGFENNSYQLLLDGYTGCWIEGNPKFIATIREQLAFRQKRLFVKESFVTLENIEKTLGECLSFLGAGEVDFFSLDVDGNDYYFLPVCVEKLNPKLVCVEYNGKFPPPTVLYMKYNQSYVWDRTDYNGASLQALANAMPGYRLVACSAVGINAFFVRKDFSALFEEYTIEELYQPARMELLAIPQGHPPAHSWLRQVLKS